MDESSLLRLIGFSLLGGQLMDVGLFEEIVIKLTKEVRVQKMIPLSLVDFAIL